MARAKKADEAPANPVRHDDYLMSSSDILFMRDNIITGLSNLESGVYELKRAYISHFNSKLPEGHPALMTLPFFDPAHGAPNATSAAATAPAPILTAAAAKARGETPGAAGEAGQKRKRKPHDPNAPKRALTSYFLFMQHNKPEIKEHHPDWTAAQISAESEKRWENITEKEKSEYDYMYQVDLCRYYRQKEAYEAGEPIPEVDAEEAKALYAAQMESGQAPRGRKGAKAPARPSAAGSLGAAAPQVAAETLSTDDDEEEEEEESPAPPPAKTERTSKRQKTAKEAEAAKPKEKAKAPELPSSAVERTSKSPEKKKKGSSSKKKSRADEIVEAEVPESSPLKEAGEGKKEKRSRKKRKSDVLGDE